MVWRNGLDMTLGSTYRLPRTVTPSRYAIELRLDPNESAFDGSVDIAVTVHRRTSEMVLNANEITVIEASIHTADGTAIEVMEVVPDPGTERVALRLASELPEGDGSVRLSFTGRINDHMVGLYRSRYRDDDGNEHSLLTTHFEATDARRCFPCWDEPDLKATFDMTLVVPESLTALANAPEIEREALAGGLARVRFGETMVMSTYLVCIIVGPLALTPAADAGGVPIRVLCRPDRLHLAGYATDVAVFALGWYGTYFDIPYPATKLDQAAIPDFAAGAMENTGLVTYRETLLLLDAAEASHEERFDVAETIAHELAHMWFGDLVTMRWWNGLWLNEAFATFMSYLCVDAMEPSWRVFEAFQAGRVAAFEVDALASARPIEASVDSPDDASGMFDVLTYTKGGAVLRMLEQWLGPRSFRDGIRRYLSKHAYGNTETHDLWDALDAESGQQVRRIMDAWITQPGYPAITVRRDADLIRLTQHRFAPSAPDDSSSWVVPLIVRQVWPGGERVEHVLVESDGLALPLAHEDALVIANAGSTAFVRTFYDDALRARLVVRAAAELEPGDRLGLVDDTWAAVVAGQASVTSFLELVFSFAGETAPAVWKTILGGLTWCDRFVEGEPRERFRAAVRELVRPASERMGWHARDGDTELDRELRGDLIRALGVLGNDPEVQARAMEAEARSRAGEAVEPAVAAAAIDVVAFVGGRLEYEAFRRRMDDAPTPQEQARYRYALTRFREPGLMERTLDLAASGAIRPQDAPLVLARAQGNRDLGEIAWRFVRDHWEELVARFAASSVISLAQGARQLTARDQVADVQAFFATHDIPQNHRSLIQAMERQRLFAALRERATPELMARFGGEQPA
jgi:puromycin-sensitive aminopeptidase